ncbi:hypothetical protein V5799_004900 [Amblyomma americanum]|uniref:Uncharacterized protein n=1 Tax=Amblyomma americanum TaxID=6943 RepID=A0AAQ4D4S8_AMBAM
MSGVGTRRLVPAVLAAGVAPSQHEPAGPPRCASSGSRLQHTEQSRRFGVSQRGSLSQAILLNDGQSWPATLAEVRPSRGCRQFGRKLQLTSMAPVSRGVSSRTTRWLYAGGCTTVSARHASSVNHSSGDYF